MLTSEERTRVHRASVQRGGTIRDHRGQRYTTTRIGPGGPVRERRYRVGEFAITMV